MITYRKATLADVEELAEIRSVFLAEANDIQSDHERISMRKANLDYFTSAIPDGSFVAWVAEDGKKIIATSGLSFSHTPPSFKCPDGKSAYIMNIFTLPDYRNQGIGTELLKRIVDEAIMLGYKKITLNATDMGWPLYEKYGFKDIRGDMALYVE